ncbi:uncharacterized protein LOC142576688 [Dermacentor variabilis]|uniref:uncharacterized protein LOC142576688 n=1 Tax=Dermacentor variabilis TaxID=34621 RepID=UPI003F5C9434
MDNDDKKTDDSLPGAPAISLAPVFAAVNLEAPLPFDFSNPGPWLVQFEDYLYVSGLYAADEELRICALLYTMDPHARGVLSSLQVLEEQMADFKQVTGKFDSYFIHLANEMYESARFHRRVQAPGELADAFYTLLLGIAPRCNYPSKEVEERLVHGRFDVGLLDSRLSDKLCGCSKFSLEEALVQMRQQQGTEKERIVRDSLGGSAALLSICVDATKVRTYTSRSSQSFVDSSLS